MKKSAILFALLLPMLLLGDNVTVGSTPMSEEVRAHIEKERGKKGMSEEEGELQTAGYVFDHFPSITYSSARHEFIKLNQSGSQALGNEEYSIAIEDASEWKISRYDLTKAFNWIPGDSLTITQNNRWFSKYDYRIINEANGTSVEANLFLGPLETGPYSHRIIAMNLATREIILSGNPFQLRHKVSSMDSILLKDWAVGQNVILGINSNTGFWGDSSCEALLINVNVNNCARSHEF